MINITKLATFQMKDWLDIISVEFYLVVVKEKQVKHFKNIWEKLKSTLFNLRVKINIKVIHK